MSRSGSRSRSREYKGRGHRRGGDREGNTHRRQLFVRNIVNYFKSFELTIIRTTQPDRKISEDFLKSNFPSKPIILFSFPIESPKLKMPTSPKITIPVDPKDSDSLSSGVKSKHYFQKDISIFLFRDRQKALEETDGKELDGNQLNVMIAR